MRGILLMHTDFNFYDDACHTSDVDTRKSNTGYIFFISIGPFSWKNRMQTSDDLSSMKRNIWPYVQQLKKPRGKFNYMNKWVCVLTYQLKFMRKNNVLYCFTDHPGDYCTTEHIDTCEEFARDAQSKGIIELLRRWPCSQPTPSFQLTSAQSACHFLRIVPTGRTPLPFCSLSPS